MGFEFMGLQFLIATKFHFANFTLPSVGYCINILRININIRLPNLLRITVYMHFRLCCLKGTQENSSHILLPKFSYIIRNIPGYFLH